MAINMRKSKDTFVSCNSCGSHSYGNNPKVMFDILFRSNNAGGIQVSLCDACMHEMLQKLIILGSKYNEVQ